MRINNVGLIIGGVVGVVLALVFIAQFSIPFGPALFVWVAFGVACAFVGGTL